MTANATLKSNTDSVNLEIVDSAASMADLISEYKAISIKLNLFADAVPESRIAQQELIEKETRLLDSQAELLESALSRSITSEDDVKAVLTLWHHEVVKSQSEDSLSAADSLVNSVCEFFQAA